MASALVASNPGTQYRPAHDDNLVADARLGAISGGICRASGENSAVNELAVKAFDHNPKTKWLDHGGASDLKPAWLEYRLLPQLTGPLVLGSYTIMSANDHPERDPTAWVVEGLAAVDEQDVNAEDMWQVLDIQRGVDFSKRYQKQQFQVPLHCPCYRWRLRITATREAGSEVQLACWELWQAQLGHGSRCSAYRPEQFSLSSRLDAPQPGLVPVSSYFWRSSNPLSTSPLSADCGATGDWHHPVAVDEHFPAWVELRVGDEGGPVTLGAYQLKASAATDRTQDPCWWVVEGLPASSGSHNPSHSGCHSCTCPAWVRLHEVILGLGSETPGSVHSFTITQAVACWRVRLRCMAPREERQALKLGGLTFYAKVEQVPGSVPAKAALAHPWVRAQDTRIPQPLLNKGRLVGGMCRASGAHATVGEVAVNAFDGNPKTKWLEPLGASEERPAWIEYCLLPDTQPVTLTSYSVTSANDHPERDPACWVLEGLPYAAALSPSEEVAWLALDVQDGFHFSARRKQETFAINPRLKCISFRLRITAVAQKACQMMQLACLDLFAEDPATVHEDGESL